MAALQAVFRGSNPRISIMEEFIGGPSRIVEIWNIAVVTPIFITTDGAIVVQEDDCSNPDLVDFGFIFDLMILGWPNAANPCRAYIFLDPIRELWTRAVFGVLRGDRVRYHLMPKGDNCFSLSRDDLGKMQAFAFTIR